MLMGLILLMEGGINLDYKCKDSIARLFNCYTS